MTATVEAHPLRRRLFSASTWTIGAYACNRLLHFGSNLITTRLLFPEAFGVMAIVNSVILGLGLLSDVGVGPSIIRDDRGRDPRFLQTAWTIQATRGVVLWVCASILSWPLALLYGEPTLTALIPVAAFSVVMTGMYSTTIFSWTRELQMGRLAATEFVSSGIAVLATIVVAWIWQTVWSLVVGSLVSALVTLIISHAASTDPRPKLRWDREIAHSIYRFGRWIFVSTAVTYLTTQGDRLILANFLSMAELGQYSIAALMFRSLTQANAIVANRVLFPLYSKIAKGRTTPELRRRVAKVRLATMAALLPPFWVLVLFGDPIIRLLYDDRYVDAGWMLEALCAGGIFLVVGAIGPIHLARGESWVGMIATSIRGVVLLSLMAIGGYLGGSTGLIMGIGASYFAYYPLQVWISRRYEVWFPMYDAIGLVMTAAVFALKAYRMLG